jgi:hypothetical protein
MINPKRKYSKKNSWSNGGARELGKEKRHMSRIIKLNDESVTKYMYHYVSYFLMHPREIKYLVKIM